MRVTTEPAEKPANSFSFTKQCRLLCAADYGPVFEQADFKVSSKTILILARHNTQGIPRLGLVISKKNVRLAVDRNRIKRLVRESFRTTTNLPTVDIVFLARRGLAEQSNVALSREIERLWGVLTKKACKAGHVSTS
ncbi:MAG: ribonuclease P protein component [Pseudomonadales bacterium]